MATNMYFLFPGAAAKNPMKSKANSSFICFGFLIFPICFCVFNGLMFLPAFLQFLHVFAYATICRSIADHQTSSTEPSVASRTACRLWMLIHSDRNGGLASFSQTLYLLAGTCQSDNCSFSDLPHRAEVSRTVLKFPKNAEKPVLKLFSGTVSKQTGFSINVLDN